MDDYMEKFEDVWLRMVARKGVKVSECKSMLRVIYANRCPFLQKWYRRIPDSFEEPDGDSKAERAVLAPVADIEPYWAAKEAPREAATQETD